MRKIKVNGRYLSWSDGSPFFYLADTAWELFHRLNREEMDLYFEQRSRQGFNAVQAVVLAEYEGVTTPNAYGRLPLYMTDGIPDPEKPDSDGGYSYWDHVDFAVDTAARYGIFITMLPTWGDKFNLCWGKGPVILTRQMRMFMENGSGPDMRTGKTSSGCLGATGRWNLPIGA